MWTIFAVLLGSIVFLAVFTASCQKSINSNDESYDFSFAEDYTLTWVGPKIGEKINLTQLKAERGYPLATVINKQRVMLAIIDQRCKANDYSMDQLLTVKNRLASTQVQHFVVSFSAAKLSQDFFKYTAKQFPNDQAFLWDSNSGPVPKELAEMVVPSHILIDEEGKVIRKWPGTNDNPSARQRIVNQIIADTMNEISR